MSVEAFTVDGKVTIDTTPFESGIAKVTSQLSELSGSMKSMMEMGGGNWNFNGALNGLNTLKDDLAVIKEDIATMNSEFANVQGINALKSEVTTLRTEMDAIKEKINQMGSVAQENVTKVGNAIESAKQKTLGWSEQIAKVTEGIVSLMTKEEFSNYILEQQESEVGQINAQWREMQGLIQSNTTFMREIEASGSNIARYFTHETQILERNVSLLEQEAELTSMLNQRSRQNATTVSNIAKELNRVANFSREVGTYFANEDKILRMSLRTIQEQDKILADKLAKSERETQLAKEIADINKMDMDLRKATGTALSEIVDLTGLEADNILKVANGEKEVLSFIEKQVSAEKERLDLIMAINEMESAQISKVPVTGGNGTKGGKNKLDKMGYLPSRIGSMALTMWGFNELMDIYNNTYSHINAEGQRDYFADRIGMDTKALNGFKSEIASMQKQYQKLDMTVVGANALETASKYGVASDDLGNLTKVMAIYGSEFVKQGRSQEDSILAINDALDGELRRLKEVGIGAEELEATGLWNGDESDKTGMILALLQIADERGYTKTAQEITNLSDAIQVLEVRLAIDLAQAFHIIEPILTETAKVFVGLLTIAEQLAKVIGDLGKAFGSWLDGTFGKGTSTKFFEGITKGLGYLLAFLIMYRVADKIREAVSGFSLLGKGWDKLQDKLGRTKGMDKASDSLDDFTNSTTGGTKGTGGGFKENFKEQWGKLGKDLGVMARVFVDVAVALAMAFLLIEEGILIISGIGYTYESLKPQFEQGIQFIQEYGIWFALLGGALLGVSYLLKDIPTETMAQVGKGALNVAIGIGIAMGLVAVAIGSLLMPLGAIISLGALANWQQGNLDKGIEVLHMFADALNQITLPVGIFIGALLVASVILGYAPMLGVGLAVGIAISIGLVAEAITMLIVPLGAIALLGASASALGEENINQGAETIRMIGRVLKVLAEAMVDLFVVDIATLGVMLTEKASQLLTGKTGLQALTDEIIPSLTDFVKRFNGLEMGEPVDQAKVQAIQQMATDIPPLFQAIQKVNNAMGTGDAVGNIFGALGGGISGAIGMGLSSKLDQLYNDVRDVMNFANKLGGLSTANGGANANAITQTANAIAQLKVKLNLLITTISSASSRVQSASQRLGSAITTGFKTGTASFNSTVVSTLAKGIHEVQSRYATWLSGGRTSAQKLADGFKTIGGKLKSSVRAEMGYALRELDNYKDDFYNKGAMLGQSLVDGFKSKKALDQNSPAKITKSIREELGYSMEALNTGKQMMYQGGVALGQALTNGYNSYGNLRTDVGVLAQKGVNSEQLQANAKNIQLNGNQKGKTPQLTQTNINIDMSNSTVIGVQDLDTKIRQAVEKAIVSINSPNGAIGY